jgi:hypothetical protein
MEENGDVTRKWGRYWQVHDSVALGRKAENGDVTVKFMILLLLRVKCTGPGSSLLCCEEKPRPRVPKEGDALRRTLFWLILRMT